MSTSDFIPVGRTSLVKKRGMSLQVQTEYASRPSPRITTTILSEGQVLHKIERTLQNRVSSLEEKNQTESSLIAQHSQVLQIIETSKPATILKAQQESAGLPRRSDAKRLVKKEGDEPSADIEVLLKEIPGVGAVYRLDAAGNFAAPGVSKDFRKRFSFVFKNLRQILDVFSEIPGFGLGREQGVYEVEPNCLYLVSAGEDYYLMYVEKPVLSVDYERAAKATLSST